MANKTGNQSLFTVDLDWIMDKQGELSSADASGTIRVETPLAFGGSGKHWTPEHLFLSAISSCFMTTYLAFAEKLNLEFEHLNCQAIGKVELVEGKYKFTHVDLYPEIYIRNESFREKATLALEKAHKYCLVANSIDAAIFYHSQVLLYTNMSHSTRL